MMLETVRTAKRLCEKELFADGNVTIFNRFEHVADLLGVTVLTGG